MIAFYFSGTGNSEYIARKFSAQMDIPCHSIEEDLRFHELLIRHSRIVICYPIYCSGIPRLMREFAQKYRKDFYQKQVFVFCTQMLYSGDGARAFLDLFPENWLTLAYAEHFFMPNNICNVFPAWTFGKKVVTHEIRRANRKIEKIRQNLYAGKLRRRGCNPLSRRLGWWQRKYFPATEEKAKDNGPHPFRLHRLRTMCPELPRTESFMEGWAHSPSGKLHVLLSMCQFMSAKSNHGRLSPACIRTV